MEVLLQIQNERSKTRHATDVVHRIQVYIYSSFLWIMVG
jgi:hypothetical protein